MHNLDDLQLLTKEELIDLFAEQAEAGVKVSFPGKAMSRRIARKVRPRVQQTVAKYGAGPAEERARNLLIEGDNLQAMVTLYRERGQVDLILTDPPYNTGGDWRYNDKWDEDPNDPGIGDLVREDDRAKHSKWMKFMFPRLQIMKQMLKPGGVLAICIDHRELFHLGQMMDELFGSVNRLAIINWEKTAAPRSDAGHVTTTTEYVLVYAKDQERAETQRLPRKASSDKRYGNPDGDSGQWREANLSAKSYSKRGDFGIQSPFTGEVFYPPGRRSWSHPKRNIKTWLEQWGSEYREADLGDGRSKALVLASRSPEAALDAQQSARRKLEEGPWPFVWFGSDGTGRPRVKTYLERVRKGAVPVTYWADEDGLNLGTVSWAHQESGRSSDGVAELTAVVGEGHGFGTVKPMRLFEKVILLWCPPGGVVMDPFAGSGTTGHAVLALNSASDAQRRFILAEQGRPDRSDSYAKTLTADRLQRAVSGKWANGEGVPLGGGFEFRSLTKKVDAEALLQMEREEMVDTVISSYFDSSRRRGSNLIRVSDAEFAYLVAQNAEGEGFYLVWDGAGQNTDLTEDVYEACVEEGRRAGLAPFYHIYGRFNLFPTRGVHFYQIPDRILSDFGLDVRTEAYGDDE